MDFGGCSMKHLDSHIAGKIAALGKTVVLRGSDGEQETKAIIDPVHSVSQAARSIQALPDGYFPPGSYQYFGLPEGDLSEKAMVVDGETVYFIRRKELYEAAGQKLYWWALMIRGGLEDAGA